MRPSQFVVSSLRTGSGNVSSHSGPGRGQGPGHCSASGSVLCLKGPTFFTVGVCAQLSDNAPEPKTCGGYSRVRRTSDGQSSHPPFIHLLEGVGLTSAHRPHGTCPPCFDEASSTCKKTVHLFVPNRWYEGHLLGSANRRRAFRQRRIRAGANSYRAPFYHPTVFCPTGVI
jgi:hypothetical protein